MEDEITRSDLTLNSTPDHVLVHLGHLPDDLVLHLVHLLVLQLVHLYVHDLNNINHFPNNFQKQYYHHRQKLRPQILLPVSVLVHVGVHLSDLLLQHVHLLLHHLPVRHHPNNIHHLPNQTTTNIIISTATNHQLQLHILLSKDALDDHLGVHLGDLVGHHGHLQLLLWDILVPLAYV